MTKTTDIEIMITRLGEDSERIRERRASAGQRMMLLGLLADLVEAEQLLRADVLERVRREAVLTADQDIGYTVLSERVLGMELPQLMEAGEAGRLSAYLAGMARIEEMDDAAGRCAAVLEAMDSLTVQQLVGLLNESIGSLSSVLSEIAQQLERRHSDEEYERLYELEARRYYASNGWRVQRAYEKWRDDECYGQPTLEDLEDYRMGRLAKMFRKGVFAEKVSRMQRTRNYPGEIDFDQMDDTDELKPQVRRHYASLRKMVDWEDGCLTVIPSRVGHHFYVSRRDDGAKQHRTYFLKYMREIELAQQEMVALRSQQAEGTAAEEKRELNYFGPAKSLKRLFGQEWFSVLATDEKRFTAGWAEGFADALMASEWRDQIALDWESADKRLMLKCMIIGVLKDAGVVKGSYQAIARQLEMDDENPATLAKYMGLGKKQPFADWITDYVNS